MKDKLPQALVVAILQACKVLGVHCVAKRIESQSSLQWLTAVGCDFAQSFALEKPTSLESLVAGKEIQARCATDSRRRRAADEPRRASKKRPGTSRHPAFIVTSWS